MMKKGYGAAACTLAAALLTAVVFLCYQVGVRYDLAPLPIDLTVQSWFFDLRTDWLNIPVKLITHLCDPTTIVALCAVLLLLPNRKTYGLPVSLAAATGLMIYKPLKHIFFRARPDVSLHLVTQGGYSFPSGHSVTSVIVYGLLFYLIQNHCKNPYLRRILSGICLFLAIFIGPSRIYVGVHWPTDVLTGWCIGDIVLILAICILKNLEKRQNR